MENAETEERVKQSKDWRKRMDEILQEMKEQQGVERSKREQTEAGRHHSISITELENAIMRQGQRLKELGQPNPYPTSYDKDSPVVHKTADGLKI